MPSINQKGVHSKILINHLQDFKKNISILEIPVQFSTQNTRSMQAMPLKYPSSTDRKKLSGFAHGFNTF